MLSILSQNRNNLQEIALQIDGKPIEYLGEVNHAQAAF